MKPRIGITASLSQLDGRLRVHAPAAYVEAVAGAGGVPIILAPADEAAAGDALAGVSALLLTGGNDLDPRLWGEPLHEKAVTIDPRRQRWDLRLIAVADERRMPVLGICLGCQELAVSRGGRLIQHVPEEKGDAVDHGGGGRPRAMHAVDVDAGSLLASFVGAGELQVNSTHHQAVREPGRGLRVVARSPDGVIEGVEDPSPDRFFLGVQWHPEDLCDQPPHRALFQALCRAALAISRATGH
ncbi:MAG: gamma-glutamyl-gamma-aminobutyrate hydrolase family protein [Planctomycetota bacterium]|nr:gamma-glutamyl-gamma-aminobutyrate hydrolase family protein [Planctomycetota bacterium]